jgi:NAD(P)-dependent dehydrogenase (short-subunit alcohol dehydrogenase family)
MRETVGIAGRLEGKVIIVTGSSRGIGRGCAVRCAEAGAAVVAHGRTTSEALEDTVELIRGAGGSAIPACGDVSIRADAERIVQEALAAFGTVDGLVNNAGISAFIDFLAVTDDQWDSLMAVNARGPFLMTQAVARAMIEAGRPGRICNVTSISGQKATNPQQVAYCTSKGAANMFTKAAALALGKHGITVNAVLPGTIETDINREILAAPGATEAITELTPLGCLGDVDDIAQAVVYLMSDEARWVTGALLAVDGGFIA